MKFCIHQGRHGHHSGRDRFDKPFGPSDPFSRHRHGGSRGGFGGGGEGGKRFFERGKFKFALLELLASEPMHGYQLIKAMEEKTGGLYAPSPGSVYPNLQLLEDMQLIGSTEVDGRKLYRITESGIQFLRERAEEHTESPEAHWEHRHHHGKLHHRGGGFGKHRLRELMKEWSEAIFLMASAAEAAKERPSSPEAEQFRQLMADFEDNLRKLVNEAREGNGSGETGMPEEHSGGTEADRGSGTTEA